MADDSKRDPPIIAQEFLGGVRVIDIGDYRVARGLSRRHHSGCEHREMLYDTQERRIWCKDCEHDMEPFDAFELLVKQFAAATENLRRRTERLQEAEKFQLRTLAAKVIDEAWRKRRMVPACPHCKQGLFPEDFKNGIGTRLGREYAEAQRKRAGKGDVQ